jgi:ATP-dependent Clp protease, protease subunit
MTTFPPPPGPPWPSAEPGRPGGGEALSSEEWLRRQLFDRRRLLVSGPLDDPAASHLCMELMALDALGDDPVELTIDCSDGATSPALAVMDVIDLLGVPVHGRCLGQAAGPAVGVLAVCSRRTVAPHARIRLSEPKVGMSGNAGRLEQRVADARERWSQFCHRVARAVGQPVDRVLADTAEGRFLSADEAVSYGVADEIAVSDVHPGLAGRPPGLRPA